MEVNNFHLSLFGHPLWMPTFSVLTHRGEIMIGYAMDQHEGNSRPLPQTVPKNTFLARRNFAQKMLAARNEGTGLQQGITALPPAMHKLLQTTATSWEL